MIKNQSRKILYLVTQSEMGGAQTYIFDLASYFDKQGWEVTVAAGEDKNGELLQKLKRVNIAAYYLTHLKRRVNFYHDLMVFFDLARLIKKVKPDIVHLNSSKAGAIGAVAAKVAGVKKIIYTVHGLVLNEPLSMPKKIFYYLAEWVSARFKDKIICVSKYDKNSVLSYKLAPEKKIEVIYNGIELDNIKLLSKEEARNKLIDLRFKNYPPAIASQAREALRAGDLRINKDDVIVGTIANFYKTKGLVYLVEAAREIKQVKDNIEFIIIGDGRERKMLEKLITNYRLEDTVFLPGKIENAKYYLKAFDMFVLPSIKEGLSYTLIEAQTAGLPVIATDTGGNPEIVEHNKTGILVKAGDFSTLANNIINLAQNQNKQKQLGENALASVKKFGLKRMIEETETIYTD